MIGTDRENEGQAFTPHSFWASAKQTMRSMGPKAVIGVNVSDPAVAGMPGEAQAPADAETLTACRTFHKME